MPTLEPISRNEALAKGLTRYFHGRPCLRGHIAQRFTRSQSCCECFRLLQNNDHWKARRRELYATTGGRQYRRAHNLRSKYGLTPEQYEAMAAGQNFQCAICGGPSSENKKHFDVDHNHDTGTVRALLCHKCNVGLGSFLESPERLEKAIAYLRKHGG